MPRRPALGMGKAWLAEDGQALLLALVAFAILAVAGAAWTALWFRATVQEARASAARQALYAAESAIYRAESQLPALVGSEATGCTTSQSEGFPSQGVQVGRATASWQATFCSGSQGTNLPTVTITGVGRVPLANQFVQRNVQVTLSLAPVFGHSLYAVQTLTLNGPGLVKGFVCLPAWLGGSWMYVSGAAYGGPGRPTITGCVQGAPNTPVAEQLPNVPFEQFARKAFDQGREWPAGVPAPAQLDPGRWYRAGDLPNSGTIEVSGPGFVGVLGDLPNGVSLKIDSDAVLVVTGNVSVNQLIFTQLGPVGPSGGTGSGLLVAGGKVSVSSLTWASLFPMQNYEANVLALTVPQNCQEVWCVRDEGNDVTVSSFSGLAAGSSVTKPQMRLFLYAARADGGAQPSVNVDISGLVSVFNGLTINAGVVSAGDATVTFQPDVSFASSLTVAPDVNGMLRFLPLLGQGVWTQVSWKEGR